MELPKHYTVLRIKRKATDPPLSSLVIEESERARKKLKESNDAGGTSRGVFRLAETVKETWAGQGKEADDLKFKIQQLMQGQGAISGPTDSSSTSPPSSQPYLGLTGARRYRVVKPQPRNRSRVFDSGRSTPTAYERFGQNVASRLGVAPGSSSKRRLDDGPPVVRDTSIPEPPPSDLKFIDAQEVYTPTPSGPSTPHRGPSSRNSLVIRPNEVPEAIIASETDDARYLPLLAEAMGLKDQQQPLSPSSLPSRAPARHSDRPIPISVPIVPYASPNPKTSIHATPLVTSAPTNDDDGDGDFVYDLYYRDLKASEDPSAAAGALAGYDDLFDDEVSDSSAEVGDEADEDSNEEDFYRNDYPEDEDASDGGGDGDGDERDREAYIQRPVRRGFAYGDEIDDDRDGFATSDEDEGGEGGRPLTRKTFEEVFGLSRRKLGPRRAQDGEDDDDEDEDLDEDEDEDDDVGMGYAQDDDDGVEVIGDVEEWRVIKD